jgi:hypothetical protein
MPAAKFVNCRAQVQALALAEWDAAKIENYTAFAYSWVSKLNPGANECESPQDICSMWGFRF